jgi:hypothetical protein
MLYGTKVAICSEINTKHINTVWQNVKFLNAKLDGASRNQQVLKGKFTVYILLITTLKNSVNEILMLVLFLIFAHFDYIWN